MLRSQQLQMLHEQERRMQQAQNLSIIQTDTKIWCPICRRQHDPKELGSILLDNSNDQIEDDNETCDLAPPGDEMNKLNSHWMPLNKLGYLSR